MKLTKTFFEDIRKLILSARSTVARGADLVQVHTNFEIGRRIVEQEQHGKNRAEYGKEVIRALSERLIVEFGKGFSSSNLAYMRTFFLLYRERSRIFQSPTGKSAKGTKLCSAATALSEKQIIQSPTGKSQRTAAQFTLSRKDQEASVQPHPFSLSWTHYVFLLGIRNTEERSFYEIESASQNWSVRELRRHFDSGLYERLSLSRNKEDIRKLAKEGLVVGKPQDLLKEPLVLEFLGLSEQTRYSESDLEAAIISQIEQFLLELGKGFLFEARQKRFTFDGEHFFVDLVFYNRLLRCYVLIDLKIGKLTHQDLGQMQMYVNHYDRSIKMKDETPTIGIILCKKKHDALVEITLPKEANIHAREYQLYLPSKEELRKKLVEWAGDASEMEKTKT